ncbi:MAG: 23S rRNA (adenine(2503)-C(2))-methyltransferase RlmN [Pseudomonadota bacterium]
MGTEIIEVVSTEPVDLLGLLPEEMEDLVASWGEPRYRGRQLLHGLHNRGLSTFEQMTDLPEAFRLRLTEAARPPRLEVRQRLKSVDGSWKLLLGLADGRQVESVLMPMERGHFTLCLSSQVGCAMGCRFCLTGTLGLTRNLSAGEIIGQVLAARDAMAADPASGQGRLANLVFMGMGEPLANLEAVWKAVTLLCSPRLHNFSRRRVTISTCGHLRGLDELARLFAQAGSEQVNLAVSLNAANDATRSQLMPINQRWPLARLLATLKQLPLAARRRITFEYILIAGVNDSDADAHQLCGLLRGRKAKINLIPFNEHPRSELRRPPEERILRFQNILVEANYTAPVRRSKGADILAACGQLSGSKEIRQDESQ